MTLCEQIVNAVKYNIGDWVAYAGSIHQVIAIHVSVNTESIVKVDYDLTGILNLVSQDKIQKKVKVSLI